MLSRRRLHAPTRTYTRLHASTRTYTHLHAPTYTYTHLAVRLASRFSSLRRAASRASVRGVEQGATMLKILQRGLAVRCITRNHHPKAGVRGVRKKHGGFFSYSA